MNIQYSVTQVVIEKPTTYIFFVRPTWIRGRTAGVHGYENRNLFTFLLKIRGLGGAGQSASGGNSKALRLLEQKIWRNDQCLIFEFESSCSESLLSKNNSNYCLFDRKFNAVVLAFFCSFISGTPYAYAFLFTWFPSTLLNHDHIT